MKYDPTECESCSRIIGCVDSGCWECGRRPFEDCCGACYAKGQCLECVEGGCWACGRRPCERCVDGICEGCNAANCYRCEDGICKGCDPITQLCCVDGNTGQCYNEANQICCNGKIYSWPEYKCCDDGTNEWPCEINKECCNGHCCNHDDCKWCDWLGGEECISICDLYPCTECDGHGNCRSRCDSYLCETCVDGSCRMCGGDPNLTCCSPDIPGLCLPKCKIVEVEPEWPEWHCDGYTLNCGGCAVGGNNCGWVGPIIIFKGGKEKICSPRGCPFSGCLDDTRVCYEIVPCVPSDWPIPLFLCKEIDSSGVYGCNCTGGLLDWCYNCVNDDREESKDKHWVQNDSCME